MTTLLVYSSLIFLTNVVHNYIKKYYFYSMAFLALVVTSLIIHSHNRTSDNYIYLNIIDKLAISIIVLYGGYIYASKLSDKTKDYQSIQTLTTIILIPTTFLSVIYLYIYGFCMGIYCFDKDETVSNNFHAMLHIISSFGHHLITWL